MTTYYVSPTGGDLAVTGGISDPWSLSYAAAGADGAIVAGDTVKVRGGTYSATTGYTFTLSGSLGNPIVFEAYTGETVVIDGAFPAYTTVGNSAWELYDAGTNTYRTVATNFGAGQYYAAMEINGVWYQLAAHQAIADLMAATQVYNTTTAYYCGPGIFDSSSSGRLYIRLEDALSTALDGRVVDHVANIDPRQNDIRICSNVANINCGFNVTGSHLTFRSFTINDYYYRTNIAADHVTMYDIDGRFGYFGTQIGAASDFAVFDSCTFDGQMYPDTWWVSWIDIKGGREMCVENRKCAFTIVAGASNWRVTNSPIINVFDGFLSGQTDTMEIDHCNPISCWDDTWQIQQNVSRGNLHHNTILGAGFGHDAAGSNIENPHPGEMYVHHNIIDATAYPRMQGRTGVSNTGDSLLGMYDPLVVTTHGTPTTGRWPSPWKFYHNTLVFGRAAANADLSYFGARSAEFTYPGVTNDLFNNIFKHRANIGAAWTSNSGREIIDGNFYDGPLQVTQSRWRFLYTSTGTINGEPGANGLNTLAELYATQAFIDSQVYYPPGWEANGAEGVIALDADYIPGNTDAWTGAVDLTATGWPGTDVYEAFRGAVDPDGPDPAPVIAAGYAKHSLLRRALC